MQILRWLFVHPILFAWILAFLAILLNWGVGGRSHEGDMHKGDKMAKHGQPAEKAGHGAAAETAHAEVKAEASAAQAPAATTSAGGGEVVAVAAAVGAAAVVATDAASASVAEQANVAGAAAETPAQETVTADSPEDLLRAAREAYWSGELDGSVGFYQSLLAKDSQPSHKGELANVFWKQGKSAEAVALYSEIAPWMAEQGRMAELNSMKVYAALVSPEKAAEIGAHIK